MTTLLNLDTYNTELVYNNNDNGKLSPNSSVFSDENSSERPMSSSMSPLSMSYEQTSLNFNNLNITIPQEFLSDKSNMSTTEPYLQIIEQPVDKFRFRYKSEMHGTHGSLTAGRNEKSKKTYPTVELKNFNGKAMVRCSLFQNNSFKQTQTQHSHSLVVKRGNQDKKDPHDVIVSPTNGYVAIFQGMGIIHTAKKHIADELYQKLVDRRIFETNESLTTLEDRKLRDQAEREAKSMNLNQVVLCFEAFVEMEPMRYERICEPVYSNPINNMKSALTGELKITRLSTAISKADGDDDLFLFVEKVGKKNIKIRFYEVNEFDEVIWQDWGRFSEADVHHQYAIALRTPPYKNIDIETPVDVLIQLYRPSDSDQSEPVKFRYKPRAGVTNRKRPRMHSNFNSTDIPLVINEQIGIGSELPGSVAAVGSVVATTAAIISNNDSICFAGPNTTTNYNVATGSNNCVNTAGTFQPFNTISTEYNKEGLLNDLTESNYFSMASIKSDDLTKILEYVQNNSDEIKKYFNTDDDDYNNKLRTDYGGDSRSNTLYDNHDNSGENIQFENLKKIATIMRNADKINENDTKSLITNIFEESVQNDVGIIFECIRNDYVSSLIKYLKLIENIQLNDVLNLQNELKQTCLHLTCILNKPQYILPLIRLGIDPNVCDINGDSALHVATFEQNELCVSKLLDKVNYQNYNRKFLDVNLQNDNGFTPLHIAVKKKNLKLVKMLVLAEADVKMIEPKNGNGILHLAVQQDTKEICEYLINETNIKINNKNSSGYTPLQLAYAAASLSVGSKLTGTKPKSSAQTGISSDSANSDHIINMLLKMNIGKTDGEHKIVDVTKKSENDSDDDSSDGNDDENEDVNDGDDDDDDDEDEDSVEYADCVDNNTESVRDEFLYQSINESSLFDDICLKELYGVFNESDNWKCLAIALDLSKFIDNWKSTDNPSKLLFRYIEAQGMDLTTIISTFESMDMKDAIMTVDQMIARSIERTF